MSTSFGDFGDKGTLSGIFSDGANNDAEHRIKVMKQLFQENAMLMADEDSVGGVMAIGSKNFDEHQRDLKRRVSKRAGGDLIDTVFWIDLINDAMAPIENALAEKYGENFMEDMAKKYLDEESFAKLSEIEDIEERKAAMREELSRRHHAGEIEIEEADIIHWLDTYRDKVAELEMQTQAAKIGVDDPNISLRAKFAAKVADEDANISDLENALESERAQPQEAVAAADFMGDFLK